MGSKRPFDGEDLVRLPFKFARSVDSEEKLMSFSDAVSWVDTGSKDDALGCNYGSLCIPQRVEKPEAKSVACSAEKMSFEFEKDLESSAALSSVTENTYEDDAVNESELKFVSSFLDRFPRKHVPVGKDHQADVPEWAPHSETNSKEDSHDIGSYMGTCVIQMPDSEVIGPNYAEQVNRRNCKCLDSGSIRCVKLHVEEAQENLLKKIGKSNYVDLGFLEMGEDVAHRWTEEEQRIFHEVVYMNPISSSKNFWICLSEKLPTRSNSELVSYYYNVFMLRIRATQNRSHDLDIDSDDDEWHGEDLYTSIEQEDEGTDSQLDYEHYSEVKGNNIEEEDGVERLAEADMPFAHKDVSVARGYQCTDKHLRDLGEIFDVHEHNVPHSYFTSLSGSLLRHNGMASSLCYHAEGSNSGDGLGPRFLYDSRESHVGGYDTFTSGLDLLPTSNMIEEIFGPGSWDKKSIDDENVN